MRAWVEDDYGDGALSYEYFGHEISAHQKKIATKTRELVQDSIGSYKQLELKNDNPKLPPDERKLVSKIISRGLQVQWVKGDADKAEQSFFKINTQGTPLDEIEELLLKNRKKPIPISARAIIRAGTGHKYWSCFPHDKSLQLEKLSKEIHSTLFEPEIKQPIKTLDLPLGGSKGVRAALQILIDFMLISNKNQKGVPHEVSDYEDDIDGNGTLAVLNKSLELAKRISGNDSGSLGLHPAVYFYGPSGRHSRAMFLGVVVLLSKKIRNNDSEFFFKFTKSRETIETILVEQKDLIATILQKHISKHRVDIFANLLDELIERINKGIDIKEEAIVKIAKLEGKIVLGEYVKTSSSFNDDVKSRSFIKTALKSAMKCPICNGFLDPEKSISYDHIIRIREGGTGSGDNCQLTHPFCNDSVKQ